MGKIICFANNKGGVGKTISASTIGLAFAKMGKRILFIDLDSQANLTSVISRTDTLDQKWERTIEDAFIMGAQEELPVLHTDDPNVDYVPTDLDLSNFEKDTARAPFQQLLLTDLLAPVKDKYEYIIIDCPPSLGVITYNALIASDYLVLVTNPEGSSYRGLEMMIMLYNEIVTNPRYNPNLQIAGIIVTRTKRDKVTKMHTDMLVQDYGPLVLKPFIPESTKVNQSTSFSRSIYEIEPEGKVANAYLEISQELIVRINDIEAGK